MILFADNLGVQATGAGFQLVATVPIDAGLLLDGALRWAISARRTTGAGTSQMRVRIGGVDLMAPGAGDSSVNPYIRGVATAQDANNLRASAITSRGGAAQATGLASVNLSNALALTFEIDLATDTDVFTFDELTVEYLPPPT